MEIKKVKNEEIDNLLNSDSYEPLCKIYTEYENLKLFIAVDNSTGDAWTEEFNSEEECIKWLEREEKEDEEKKESFVIDDDNKAEWALKKIAEEKKEKERLIDVCKNSINQYKNKIAKIEKDYNNKVLFFEGQLQRYFGTVEHRKTKTQEIYKLPSGVLRLKYVKPSVEKDDHKLIDWLIENNLKEYLDYKVVNWTALKKKTKQHENKLIFEDGQIIDGVKLVENDFKFDVEIKE